MTRTTRSRRTARGAVRTAAAPVIAALLIGASAAGAQAHATAPTSKVVVGKLIRSSVVDASRSVTPVSTTKRKVKFYVVQNEFNGEPEFLFEIAQRFLNDGNRAQEIFELNVGREQPDGEKLVRNDTILPGWQLILPDDAEGDELQVGEVTVAQPPATATSPAAANPPAGQGTTAPKDEKIILSMALGGRWSGPIARADLDCLRVADSS